VPTFSLVGGKLTTCRAVAEEMTVRLLAHLGSASTTTSRGRPVPGGDDYPSAESLDSQQQRIARSSDVPLEQVQAVWSLCGTRTEDILASRAAGPDSGIVDDGKTLPGTDLPYKFVRWVIRNQWVTTVSDLVERRLMLLYHRQLSRLCLRTVADLLRDERSLTSTEIESQLQSCIERLQTHYGKSLVD
jgi:glycerol-3-phosphate dehydrogenase